MKTAEEQSKHQLFSNRAFGWKKGYFVTMNNRTSFCEQLHCIHPQHTHSPCTSTCTTHPAIPSQLPSTTLLCTELTNTKHSWQNGTRCSDGVNVLWCHPHLVWLLFEGCIGHVSSICCNCIPLPQDGWTPLMIACRKRHVHIMNMLIDNGAQVNLQTQVL